MSIKVICSMYVQSFVTQASDSHVHLAVKKTRENPRCIVLYLLSMVKSFKPDLSAYADSYHTIKRAPLSRLLLQ